jgi:hypothetical protein
MEDIMMEPKKKFSDDAFMPKGKKRLKKNMMLLGTVALIIVIVGLFLFAFMWGKKSVTGSVISEAARTSTGTAQKAATVELSSSDVVQKIILLRQYSNSRDLVNTAESVSGINKQIESVDIAELRAAWRNIVDCVFDKCADNAYVNMIDALSMMQIENQRNGAIHSVVETFKLWTGKNQLYFSDSLSQTNKLLIQLDNKDVNKAWQELVKCNGQCEGFSDLTISLIQEINQAK